MVSTSFFNLPDRDDSRSQIQYAPGGVILYTEVSHMYTIPKEFFEDMRPYLGDRFDDFYRAMTEGEARKGLRVNTLKVSSEDFMSLSPVALEKSPLCREGYFVPRDAKPGSHPYHQAGLYYMQEPSAGCVIEALDPTPGMRVLDLCAAPGGKSGHIAARLAGTGLLVANECVASRAKILRSNLERLGVRNGCVTSAMPDRVAAVFPSYFDAVVVDAPCSGEGMFRKEESAGTDWSREHVKSCAARQSAILDSAAETVAENGLLLYSTCTLNPLEDEAVVDAFLKSHPDFRIEAIDAVKLPSAHPEWCGADSSVALAAKLMPHEVEGEGHFVARMRRTDGTRRDSYRMPAKSPMRQLTKDERKLVTAFWDEQFTCPMWAEPMAFGETVFLPTIQPGLPVLCSGVPMGTLLKGRFEPEHGLYLAMNGAELRNTQVFAPDDEALSRYLAGQEIPWNGQKGFGAVCVGEQGKYFPIGFGKASNGILKNKYPKGLRR